jgi:hypothetical protein
VIGAHAGVRPTRRQALLAALAGAIGLTLPAALRTAPAGATTVPDCQKGCQYVVGKRYADRMRTCRTEGEFDSVIALFNPLLGLVNLPLHWNCEDNALLKSKAEAFDCYQPGCPGFDPFTSGGPCEGCQGYCCVCPATDVGYICCVFPCNDANHSCCPS